MDQQERLRHLVLNTHPEDLKIGLTLGLWRTFAHPDVARQLASAGGLINDPAGRASATGDALLGLMEEGLDSPASKPVLARLQGIHDGIDPDLMRFVLTAFTLPPIRFIDQYGWRPLTDTERNDYLSFASGLARELGIQPPAGDVAEWTRWADAYEQQHFGPSCHSLSLWQFAGAPLAARRLPRPLRRPLQRSVANVAGALLDARVRSALGLAAPSATGKHATAALLRLRGWVIRRRQTS
ncbi:oxygenase MpaB family protein [Streptacidiphilus rugosus]|uniref:oxygenase MpaB family protein n=1 Tax=Streptacidiphilus rugosus TaxID=405783 RepID=UPI00068FA8DB|nr:oxygenase MpaB family protein [Streptacidiphilus rugosus]